MNNSKDLCSKYTTEIDNNSNNIRNDSLDYALRSIYDHSKDLFLDKSEIIVQNDTIASIVCPRRRNVKILKGQQEQGQLSSSSLHQQQQQYSQSQQLNQKYDSIIIGGLQEKRSPFSVKLINCGHHKHMTNPGYSRKPLDGNFFNY